MTPFTKVAIIGTGTMGPGMAAVLERAGCETLLYDISPVAIEKAQASVELARGILDRLDAASVPGGGLAFSTSLEEAVADTDLVIEAVPEQIEVKHEVFAEIIAAAPVTALLASNTSGIPITDIAAPFDDEAGRIIGMHWSNPPHLIPLIEVIPGKKTASDVAHRVIEFAQSLGYEAVLEREVAGFVENRILYAILRECLELVERGIISHADMDTCVKWGIGYKLAVIGPLELIDMAGLDIYNHVGSYLNQDLSTAAGVSSFITERVDAGRLGLKSLGGIYDYSAEEVAAKGAARATKLVAVRQALRA